MKVTQPDYYPEFSCIAGECPDSCCIGWQVIPDQEHLEYYNTLPGELGEAIRAGIVDTDGEPSFALCNGRCCMLREDGLCKIQYALGEGALSTVCDFYPRFVTELGLIREQGLSISCPEVARIILTREAPVTLNTFETNDPLRYFHDIEPERLLAVQQGRAHGIETLQNRTLSLATRMKALLNIGLRVDEIRVPETEVCMSQKDYFAFRQKLYGLFLSLERLRAHWTEILEKGAEGDLMRKLSQDICWEQLLVYFLYKYALRSAMDDTFLERIIMSILSVILLQDLNRTESVDLIYLVQLFAKETEHSEDNLDTILKAIEEEPAFSPESVLELLNYLS